MMALDQGTTSSRCILFDKSGHMRSVVQEGSSPDISETGLGGARPSGNLVLPAGGVAVGPWEKSARRLGILRR